MSEWGVFGVIAALVTFGVCVGAPLLKLNSNITRLNVILKMLQKQFDKFGVDNEKEHEALRDKNAKQDDEINDHETRITVLEKKDT